LIGIENATLCVAFLFGGLLMRDFVGGYKNISKLTGY
jgi:hypothetical protein